MQVITTQLRQGTDRPLNILTCPTHEAYETNLAKTGFNFYAIQGQDIKPWNTAFRPVPSNYTLLNSTTVPKWLSIDLILSQQKFGQYQILAPLAQQLNVPMISLEHTLPVPNWPPSHRQNLSMMRGHSNIFISEYSIKQWGFDEKDPTVQVVHHGVDTDVFSPDDSVPKTNAVLSVVNDWKNRDWCCGYSQWERVINGLPFRVVGDNPGLSTPAKSTEELVNFYRSHTIFLNTAHISPIPSVLLEAMSCGMAVVSCASAAIPNYITHGHDGLLANNEAEMRHYLETLLQNPDSAKELGENAAKTIKEKFNLENFVNSWQKVINEASQKIVCR
jgi:glycosyltransferase involved in cell wall biosynthesis